MAALDFSPLDGPLDAGEARARRRSLRAGRPGWTEITGVQIIALPFLATAWLVVVPSLGVVAVASLTWLLERGATRDFQWGAPVLLGSGVVAVIVLAWVTRLTFIPPRWGRWVRMQRFAEANELVFLRRARAEEVPGAVRHAAAGIAVLSDTFVDSVSGVVVGNAGEGFGRQGFVLVPDAPLDDGAGDDGVLAPGEEPLRGFDLVPTTDGMLAVRHRAVGRSSADIRRLFATADAVRRGDRAAIR